MNTREKQELFGGALRCAGLAVATMAATVHADFLPHEAQPWGSFDSNYTFLAIVDANDELILSSFDESAGAAFPATTSYSGPGGSISAYANSAVMGTNITLGEPGHWNYATADVRQWFTVEKVTQVRIDWDLTAAAPEFASVYLSDAYPLGALGEGVISDTYDNGFFVTSGAGAMTFTLEPGTVYLFHARANTWFASGLGDVSVRMTIVPGPNAAALFTLSAIGMRRRRRRA